MLGEHKDYIAFEDKAFNFHEFFRTWTGDYEVDHANMPAYAKVGDFVHENDVLQKYYDEDVFIAAGRRIRNVAKEADTLNPTERVQKIAGLFKYFKNPDKETVLTPWRVVNMHMSDCLGGWDFYSESHKEDEMPDKPRFVDQGTVTHDVFFKPDTKILEINSKTGLYPLYVTYSVFRAKCESVDKKALTIDKQREIWFETVRDNIYVVCKTPMAKTITKRTLVGYSAHKINAHYFDDLINTMANKSQLFIEKVSKESYWKKGNGLMKFDAIVGNPPYQASDGGSGASSGAIYPYFVSQSKMLNPEYISMIIPSRWFATGRGTDVFREEMLHDVRLARLHDFINASECFSGVDIKGGVCYFLWDKKHTGTCNVVSHKNDGTTSSIDRDLYVDGVDVFVRDNELISILKKVQSFHEESFMEIVSPRDPFGYDIREENSFKSIPHKYSLEKSMKEDVEFYYNGWRKNGVGYVAVKTVGAHTDWVDKYKVFVPNAWGSGNTSTDGFVILDMQWMH